MNLAAVRWISIPHADDDRGTLTAIEGSTLPFGIKRVFYMHGMPDGRERGAHAHRDTQQVVVAASGSFRMDISDQALDILGRKKNLRVLEGVARWPSDALDYKRVRGGLLVQDRPPASFDDATWRVVTKREPTEQERRDLLFAWRAVASVKSNAIVLARDGATIGIGAGQMSRVDASFLAVHKAASAGHTTAGAVLGSDAFFPFRDGVDQAVEAGVRAIVQPGGSVRDAEVIAAADEHDIAMVFTGVRLFRH